MGLTTMLSQTGNRKDGKRASGDDYVTPVHADEDDPHLLLKQRKREMKAEVKGNNKKHTGTSKTTEEVKRQTRSDSNPKKKKNQRKLGAK